MLSLSQIATITGARGNACSTCSRNAMKTAAQRRPSRYTQAPVVTPIAPRTGSAIVAAYDIGVVGGIGRLVLEVTGIVRASRR